MSYSEATKTGVEFTCVDEITDEEAGSIVSDHACTVDATFIMDCTKLVFPTLGLSAILGGTLDRPVIQQQLDNKL